MRADLDFVRLPGGTLTDVVETSVRTAVEFRRVEFTPEADADLDRWFDFLLDRAQTVEEAMRAYEGVEVIRMVVNSHLAITSFTLTSERRNWSSFSAPATSAKRNTTEVQQKAR